jgi:hypothetical protein
MPSGERTALLNSEECQRFLTDNYAGLTRVERALLVLIRELMDRVEALEIKLKEKADA